MRIRHIKIKMFKKRIFVAFAVVAFFPIRPVLTQWESEKRRMTLTKTIRRIDALYTVRCAVFTVFIDGTNGRRRG